MTYSLNLAILRPGDLEIDLSIFDLKDLPIDLEISEIDLPRDRSPDLRSQDLPIDLEISDHQVTRFPYAVFLIK
jgi:hypothetical protein